MVISWEFGPTVCAPAASSSVTARTHYSHLSNYHEDDNGYWPDFGICLRKILRGHN